MQGLSDWYDSRHSSSSSLLHGRFVQAAVLKKKAEVQEVLRRDKQSVWIETKLTACSSRTSDALLVHDYYSSLLLQGRQEQATLHTMTSDKQEGLHEELLH